MSVHVYNSMIGAVITNIEGATIGSDKMSFYASNGKKFIFHHWQSCCENVSIDDICGDINDLLNSPIIEAEEVSNTDAPKVDYESYTWTFYRYSTNKGSVTVKWLGTSNGYYSEGVYFDEEISEENNDEDYSPMPVKNTVPTNLMIGDESNMPGPIALIDFEVQWKRICQKVKALNMGYDIYLYYFSDKWMIMATGKNDAVYASYSIADVVNKYESYLDSLISDKKNKLQEELKKFEF